MDYLERVKEVHVNGGYGSIGYRSEWKLEETQKNILRTHTTAVSSRMLYKLAQEVRPDWSMRAASYALVGLTACCGGGVATRVRRGMPQGFKPVKYFSIDRVFRNESLDATHLAEFHQVEGVIADYGLSLGDLIGIMQAFFTKLGTPTALCAEPPAWLARCCCRPPLIAPPLLGASLFAMPGIHRLRFKPAFNPYTEPSMEVFGFHEGARRGEGGRFRRACPRSSC